MSQPTDTSPPKTAPTGSTGLDFQPQRNGLGVELSTPIQDIGADAVPELRERVWRHRFVLLSGQDFTDEEYVAFGHRLGTVRPYFQEHYHHPDHPEIFVSSNVPQNGQKVGVAGTGRMWHTDYSFFDDPLSMTMVCPRILPASARGTHYVDMVRVLAELPDHLREPLEGKRCFHDATNYYKVQPKDIDRAIIELVEEFRAEAPGAWHPAFIEHPVTGDKSLYVSSGFTTKVEGMRHEEGEAFLKELFAFVEQERFIVTQEWRIGDIFLWDNRPYIHHATTVPKGEQSCSYRISFNDGLPFYAGHTGAVGLAS